MSANYDHSISSASLTIANVETDLCRQNPIPRFEIHVESGFSVTTMILRFLCNVHRIYFGSMNENRAMNKQIKLHTHITQE